MHEKTVENLLQSLAFQKINTVDNKLAKSNDAICSGKEKFSILFLSCFTWWIYFLVVLSLAFIFCGLRLCFGIKLGILSFGDLSVINEYSYTTQIMLQKNT